MLLTSLLAKAFGVETPCISTSNKEQYKEQQPHSSGPPKLETTVKYWWWYSLAENPAARCNPQAQPTPAPFGVAVGTCCPGDWRRPGACSAVRSWAAESERTSGRRSAPRRPRPPLPSSAAHVSAWAREQRREPAWTSAPGTRTLSPGGSRARLLLRALSRLSWEASPARQAILLA